MPKKVFELANELGKNSLELVEELKTRGLAIRSHMTVLSDEEVLQVKAMFSAQEAVNKVTKKKVKKLKVDKAPTPVNSESGKKIPPPTRKESVISSSEEEERKSSGSTIRKKAVVRRKLSTENLEGQEHDKSDLAEGAEFDLETVTAGIEYQEGADDGETEVFNMEESFLASGPLDEDSPLVVTDVQSSLHNDDKEGLKKGMGLRVVARPEAKVVSAPPERGQEPKTGVTATEKDPNPSGGGTDEFTRKPHRFTPVFIPEKKSKLPVEDGKESNEVKVIVPPADEFDDDRASKKKVGSLAALMSGKVKAPKLRDISQMRADEELKSYQALSGLGRPIYTPVGKKKVYVGPSQKTKITATKESKRCVDIYDFTTVENLAKKLKVKFKDLRDKVLDINLLVKIDDVLGLNLAQEIALLYDYRVENVAFKEEEVFGVEDQSQQPSWPQRDPVVAIMGHVDHGKTTLLDTIRETKVASQDAGGITQHIGAYTVDTDKGKRICFLDTPGHAAFGQMRQRGANATDIVILVVAADDGVMPQTVESIKYCKIAQVPIVVAINKMDKEGANPDRIKQALVEYDLTPEDWGGHTQYVQVSALKGQGVDELLDAVLLQAEMLELTALDQGVAEGVVIESRIELGRGPVATILIQRGCLKKGDNIVCGETFGRARSLVDYTGKNLESAGPSTPVQILGLADAPNPGDVLNVVKNEREAKKLVDNRILKRKELEMAPQKSKLTLEDFFAASKASEEKKVLKLIVRADVQGSFEAVKNSLLGIGNDELSVEVIGGGVGAINDGDVVLADSVEGLIIGFNMRPVNSARRLAEERGVEIKTYSIIYELINDVKLSLEGLLAPAFVEKFIGRAEVRETFNIPKIGVIAGSIVVDGKIQRGCNIRLLRDGKIVFDGKLSSLKRFKDDVKEVNNGYECGISLDNFNDVKQRDIFEAYILEEQKRHLEESGPSKNL